MALTAKKVYAILKRQISDMEAKLNSPVRYRGTVATADLLPLNPDIGDMYNIESKSIYGEAGMNVAWNGVVWDTMGAPIDMSLYLTKEEAEAVIQRLVTEYFEKNPVKPGATTEQAQQIEQNKTDIGSLKVETGSLKEDISNKITKFYASSQGETHLADSDNSKIVDMMLYGKSEQKQYSGKNLIPPITYSGNISGLQIDVKEGLVRLKGTPNAEVNYPVFGAWSVTSPTLFTLRAGDYTASGCGDTSNPRVNLVYLNNGRLTSINGNKAFTLDEDANFVAVFVFADANKYVDITFTPMIEKGSRATSYEPYTGGIPSPNPDYPQEIKSVVNPTVKVCGKNIINGKHLTHNAISFEIDKVVIKDNTETYSEVFAQYTLKKGTYTISCECNYINRIETIIGGIAKSVVNKASNSYTFTIDKDSSAKFTVVVYNDVTDGVDYIQLEKGSVATPYEPYHEHTVTLPYTLNAIPVSSGGNVTIDGQQYIADYVDVERGKLVRHIKEKSDTISIAVTGSVGGLGSYDYDIPFIKNVICNITNIVYEDVNKGWASKQACISGSNAGELRVYLPVGNHNVKIIYELATPIEIDLTPEEIAAFKALATYYPTTNISVNSEQLDGYTVFNYPISMENGWNYVKQQIGDTRDYIYDMDARTQDTDLQAAEAYVNSEYAVALTELEV
jgi:hypothetical protein